MKIVFENVEMSINVANLHKALTIDDQLLEICSYNVHHRGSQDRILTIV